MLVVGVMAAVMLEREAAQRRVIRNQVIAYDEHHTGRGLREVLNAWGMSLVGQPLKKMLDKDGHAVDLVTPDGGRVRVFVRDGQGRARAEFTGLAGSERRDAEGIFARLVENAGDSGVDAGMTRTVGPAAVSAAGASEEVLEAVISYASEGKKVRDAVRSIMDAREDGELTEADLSTAAGLLEIETESRSKLLRLLTLTPELWDVEAVVYAGSDRPVARFGGLLQVARQTAGVSGPVSLQSMGSFLTWERLPIE